MPGKPRSTARRADNYFAHTQRPLNCLVFVLPLLVTFHVGAALYGTSLLVPHYLLRFLQYFGAGGTFLPPLLIVVVLLLQHLGRRDPWKIHWAALVGMVAESLVLTIPLIVLARLAGQAAPAAAPSAANSTLVALGAGIYEEFIFRLMFVSLVMLLLVDVFGLRKEVIEVLAVVGGAVVFSLCHFSPAQVFGGEPFDWGTFILLTLAGILWGGAYVIRGFGIAVGSHVLWDLYVFFFCAKP